MEAPTYIPILRLREQEKGVLTSFDFGDEIYPYVEIFKKQPREPAPPKAGKEPKPRKEFNKIYLPILNAIKCKKVFVDLPVHLGRSSKLKKPVLEFVLEVIENRTIRTARMLSLKACRNQIIPVISTYSGVSGETNSIRLQEADLRVDFVAIAYRTSVKTFNSDITQIEAVAKAQDFLFVDLEEFNLENPDDLETIHLMVDRVKLFGKCTVVTINSPIHHLLTNSGLEHGAKVMEVNNCLIDKFQELGGHCFSDYAGVKKDLVEDGGGISPGLLFYHAIDNVFFGFRGRKWKKGEDKHFGDIRGMILQDLMTSEIVKQMEACHLEYLGTENKGWQLAKDMYDENVAWKSQSKLKRIAMEHYLHCIKTKIRAGYFLL